MVMSNECRTSVLRICRIKEKATTKGTRPRTLVRAKDVVIIKTHAQETAKLISV